MHNFKDFPDGDDQLILTRYSVCKNKGSHGRGRIEDDQGRSGVLKNGSNWSNFPKALVSISYPGNFRIRP